MSPVPVDFASALVAGGREAPEALAFTFGGARLCRGELLDQAARLAGGLVARGVVPGDRVGLVLPAGLDFVRGFSAVTLAGAVPFAIHPDIAPSLAAQRAARGRPRLVLTTAARADTLAAALAGLELSWAAIEELPCPVESPPLPPEVDPESPAVLQLTSGTTGEPRFAVLSHRALAAWRDQAAGLLLPGPGDVLAGWVPPWGVMGLIRFVILPVVRRVETHLVAPTARALGDWLETAARVRATFSSAPDFALRTAVRLVGDRDLDLASLRCLVTGGEPVRRSTLLAFECRFNLPGIVRPAYGLSEATLAVTCVRPGEPLTVDRSGEVSCGRPLPGVEVAIVDSRGAECPPGEPGEILVRSASLFSGYFDAAPSATRPTSGGWLATGDGGRLGPAGELFVLGRRRNLLKHGGATYAPRELEEAAETVREVSGAAAISLARDARPGALLVLVVEAADAVREAADDLAWQVAGAVRREVGIAPGEVLVVTPGTLPRTESGKLRHAELRRALAAAELAPERVLSGRAEGWSE
ncbi:MAG: AMP-binding protein [Thermoanaerobaculia bacterium]